MGWLIRLFSAIGRGIWGLLTRGLQIGWLWLRDGFFHALAGGAISGNNKVLDHARTTANSMGVRSAAPAIGYSGNSSSSSSSSSPARTSNFMGQFL